MKFVKIATAVSSLLFVSIFAGDMGSEWVESGQMLRYPASKYFYGVGRSDKSSEEAKANSVAGVLNQIVVEVKSIQKSEEYDLVSSDSSKQSSIYESSVRLKSEGKIEGTKIIATAKRGNYFYAFSALSKDLFIKNRKSEISSLQKEVLVQFYAAKKSLEEGNITSTLRYLSEAKKSLRKLNSARSMLSGAVALTSKEDAPVSRSEINGLYNSCLSSLEVKKVSGNNQEFFMNELPSAPFVAKVTVAGTPAISVPFVLLDGTNKKVATTNSDSLGIVTFFLAENAEVSKGVHIYQIKPNLKISKKQKESLGTVSQKFKYSVKSSPKSVKIVTTAPTSLNYSQEKLNKKVGSLLAKYDILNDSCSYLTLEISLDYKEGEVISGISEKRSLIRTEVFANFSLKNENGVELLSFEKEANGAGSSIENSVSKAISLLKIKIDIVELKKLLPEPKVTTKNEKPTIIILPFKNSSPISNWYDISQSLTAMIITGVVNSGNYQVVERDQIKKLVDEKGFQEKELDFAKFAGASLAIIGNAASVGGKIEVDARIVEVETGLTLAAVSATGSSAYELRKIASQIQKKLEEKSSSAALGGRCK